MAVGVAGGEPKRFFGCGTAVIVTESLAGGASEVDDELLLSENPPPKGLLSSSFAGTLKTFELKTGAADVRRLFGGCSVLGGVNDELELLPNADEPLKLNALVGGGPPKEILDFGAALGIGAADSVANGLDFVGSVFCNIPIRPKGKL